VIVAIDVQYDDEERTGLAAAVAFQKWNDSVPSREWTYLVENIEPYVPGQFYKRELPCLLAVLAPVIDEVTAVVVDGHVWLAEDRPGLGHYLWKTLLQETPVIGVAKSRFHGGYAQEVLRGSSKKPLYVTAAGMDADDAALCIVYMHGPNRHPTLLKRVDALARGR
jgi:deoxyribonuclease V